MTANIHIHSTIFNPQYYLLQIWSYNLTYNPQYYLLQNLKTFFINLDNLTAIKRDDITFRELGKKLRERKERIEDTCIRMTNGLRRIYDSFKITLSSTIKIGIYYPLFSYFITRSSKEPMPRIYVLNLRFEKSGKIEEKKKKEKENLARVLSRWKINERARAA